MYNRYVPQEDGSYEKRSVNEEYGTISLDAKAPPPDFPPPPTDCVPPPKKQSVLDFLKQLLPRGLDTADLLVVVLLLLMAGDSPEDQGNAMLTLGLYLFL